MQATSNINFKPLSKGEQLVFNKFEYNINKENKGIIQKIKNLMNSLKIRLFIGSKQCERKMNEFNSIFKTVVIDKKNKGFTEKAANDFALNIIKLGVTYKHIEVKYLAFCKVRTQAEAQAKAQVRKKIIKKRESFYLLPLFVF